MEFPIIMLARCCTALAVSSVKLSLNPTVDGMTFHILCSCDRNLDPMTFKYELEPYALKIGWLRSTVVERRSFAGELLLFCA